MNNLRRFCAALALGLVLSLSAVAGEIGCPGITSNPPPPPPSQVIATGDILTPGIAATGDTPATDLAALDPLTEITLSLLQSVLSLF